MSMTCKDDARATSGMRHRRVYEGLLRYIINTIYEVPTASMTCKDEARATSGTRHRRVYEGLLRYIINTIYEVPTARTSRSQAYLLSVLLHGFSGERLLGVYILNV